VHDDLCSSNYNGTGNVCGRVQVEVSVAGTYFVQVLPSSPTASGTYSVRVLPRYDQGLTWDTASEPDDVLALAPAINVGRAGAVNRVIYPRGSAFTTVAADTDVVRFDAPDAGTYVAEVFNVASGLGRMRLYLYDSAGTLIGSDTYCYNGTGNVCGRVQVEVSVAGTYFVQVLPSSPTASGLGDALAGVEIAPDPLHSRILTWRPGQHAHLVAVLQDADKVSAQVTGTARHEDGVHAENLPSAATPADRTQHDHSGQRSPGLAIGTTSALHGTWGHPVGSRARRGLSRGADRSETSADLMSPRRHRRSQDRAARRHLNGGNPPAVQHHEPVTMPAAKHTGILGKRRNDLLDDLVYVDGVGLFVRDVHVIAASQPDAQHNLCHGHAP